jgi:hypothetical protein
MAESVPPLSILELDQLDIFARLQQDPFFQVGIPVLMELKGITERDIAMRIQTANQQNGKVGTVVVVLMPILEADAPNAPGPRYKTIYEIQVIDYPMMRRQVVGGTTISADECADRTRQILHRFNMGRGQTLYFDGMQPRAVPEGKVSYVVKFNKMGVDNPPAAAPSIAISPQTAGNQTVTLTCADASAAIWYTLDGSYPGSNPVASPTAARYSGPFSVAAGQLLRTAAEDVASGYQQSQAISQFQY